MAGEGLIPFNRQMAVEFISSQTQKIVSAQVEAADRIIVSQERVESGIDKVGVSVDRVADGLEGLASAFEWGFSEIVWHLEQEREVLKDILKVLQAPLDTQAKELRKRAEEAYKNGWIDDALQDFLESEKKNRYDFTVHHSLGNIYFFHKKVPEKALEHYEKAAKYARPKSPYHASITFLHMAEVKYTQQDFEGAYESVIKALELFPNLGELYFASARYCAKLGKYDEAIENLKRAIERDRNYCLKPESEKDFQVMRERLHSFFGDLRNQAQNETRKEVDKAEELIRYAESYGICGSDKFLQAKKKHSESMLFLSRASLFDCWDATYRARDVCELVMDGLEGYLAGEILKASEQHTRDMKDLEESQKTSFYVLCGICIIAVIALCIHSVIHTFEKEGTGWGICELLGSPIAFCILAGISVAILWVIFHIITFPILYFLRKRGKRRYESRLADLDESLSQIQNKRIELVIHTTVRFGTLER